MSHISANQKERKDIYMCGHGCNIEGNAIEKHRSEQGAAIEATF